MAGIDFMAFANGMMQADKLNKEDDTYWRKQRTDDIAAQNLERDQAYRGQVQGYGLNTLEDIQQNKDAASLAAQAWDAYVQKAKALGVPTHQVIMDSPAFQLPDATPAMQALFNAKLSNAIQTNIISPLRQKQDFESANKLLGKLGLPGETRDNPLLSFGDPEKEAAFISSRFPGIRRSENGKYQFDDLTLEREDALMIANSTPTAALAALSAIRRNRLQGLTTQNQQAQLQASGKAAIDTVRWDSLAAKAQAGVPLRLIHPDDQETYAKMLGDAPTATSSDPYAAATSRPNQVVTPGWVTEQNNPGVLPAMPVRQSDVPVAAMPVRRSDVPVAAMPSTADIIVDGWKDFFRGGVQQAKQKELVKDLNHKSSKELSDLRSAITTGADIPGLSPTQLAVYLKDINEEIASRHKLEAVRYQRSMKQ